MRGSRNLSWAGIVLGLICVALLWPFSAGAQQPANAGSAPAAQPGRPPAAASDGLWRDVPAAALAGQGARQMVPTRYRTLALDEAALAAVLAAAPLEGVVTALTSPAILTLPLPDGTYGRFSFVNAPIMEPALAAKFPEISTYLGQGIDDRAATVRFDRTPEGFHAMILAPGGTVIIDPYRRGDTTHYLSYFHDAAPPPVGTLFAEAAADLAAAPPAPAAGPHTPSGTQLRTYRIAVAATGEYTAYHGGTVPLAMAAVTTSLNRIVGLFEREVAVRLVLVANNNLVIYTNAATDPYTDGNPSAMVTENQTTLDAVIGNANYDVGHVFGGAGGGGLGVGPACEFFGNKGRGATSYSSPGGDYFDIQLVAHELGHQFNAPHSFNGTTGSCGSSRAAGGAYEPGSGSTIMGYAGICGAENLQARSDPYFHTSSLEQMIAYTTTGQGSTCGTVSATGNNPPVVNAGPSFTIPQGTAFKLTGSATDPDGDRLTYTWEQFNLGAAAPPNTDDGTRPIFRSFLPSLSPARFFPHLYDIVNNTTTLGESLPTTNRTLTFHLTARDNRAGGGGVDYGTVNIPVTTSAGPFLVTAPNTAVSWPGGSAQTVTWNVASTTAAPVSCANVNILLSLDGGTSFATTLLANTPNDGTQGITVPNLSTTQARVQVECATNIFFDMSNVNFTITGGPTATPTPAPCGVSLLTSPDVPKTIPDCCVSSATSAITVPASSGTLLDLDLVGLNITHTNIGDYRISLTSPASTTVILINRACNTGGIANYANTTLDDSASVAIGATCPPLAGAPYRPANPLSAFNGQNPTGVWRLTVTDLGPGSFPLGTLNAWGLRLTTVGACATPTRTPTVTPTRTLTATSTPTRTATPTNTPSATPTTALRLVGHVTWQGRPTPPHALNQLPITLTLRMGANPPVHYPGLTTDAGGFFTVSVQTLPTGVYTWWSKGPQFLANGGTLTLTGAPTLQHEMGQQRAGDVNNTNLVDITDFSLLRASFGKACSDGGYDGRADFTGDCLIDITDFTLLRGNFGQAGATSP